MENIIRKTRKFDAEGMTVGRLSTQIVLALRGKDKPEFNPAIDGGDNVLVINIKKLKFSGKKMEQKKYYSYSGYPGGLKTKKMSEIFENNPAEILLKAVKRMLPDNRLRDKMIKRLVIK